MFRDLLSLQSLHPKQDPKASRALMQGRTLIEHLPSEIRVNPSEIRVKEPNEFIFNIST